MLRAPLRYIVALLLGIALGWIGSFWRDDLSLTKETVPAAPAAQPTIPDSATEPQRSAAQVLELAKPGGGLQRDAELADALKAMKAEDFRAAVALWTTKMQASLQGDVVRARAVLDRWFELDPESARAFAERLCKPTSTDQSLESMEFCQTIAASAARHDPEWALGHLLFDRPTPAWFNPNSQLMAEVAERNPALAKEWLQRMENTKLRNSIMTGYVIGVARNDPLAAMDLAVAEKGFERVNLIPHCVQAAASKGRGVALEALAKIDDPNLRRKAAFGAIHELANETNTQPFPFLEEAIGRENLSAMESEFTYRADAIVANPSGAANWAAGLPDESRKLFLNWILESWQRLDSKAAVEWMQQQRAGESTEEGGNSATAFANIVLANRLMAEGKTAEAIVALSPAAEEGMHLGLVAYRIAADDPEAAAHWAATMPEGKNRDEVVGEAAGTWAVRDPAAATQWIEQLPAGALRNQALAGMIERVFELDAEGASRWAPLITDPDLRITNIERIYFEWAHRDRTSAREWVRNVPNVDERWRAKFLRRQQ